MKLFKCLTSIHAQRSDGFKQGRLIALHEHHHTSLLGVSELADFQSDQFDSLKCPAGVSGQHCASDCATLLTCNVGAIERDPIASIKCSSFSSYGPYCIPGKDKCSTVGDENIPQCSVPKLDFTCTDIGYFPNPKNCSKYIYCGDTTAEEYECPYYYVYDPKIEQCKPYQRSTDCATINCLNQDAYPKFLAYSAHKAFYGLCLIDNDVITTLVLRCEDIRYFEYNPVTVTCEFKCPGDGQYPDSTDCLKFYECYRFERVYNFRIKSCPTGLYFDKKLLRCVRGSCPQLK